MSSFLSTNEKILRQDLQILNPYQKTWVPNQYPNMGVYPAQISIQNQLLRHGLKKRKFRLAFFYIQNSYVPNNIPMPLFSFPQAPNTMANNISGVAATVVGGTIGVNSINYYFNLYQYATFTNYTVFLQHVPTGNFRPPVIPYTDVSPYYNDPYYWNYSTSYFTDYLSAQINQAILTVTGVADAFIAVATSTGYRFYIQSVIQLYHGIELQLSQSLLNLYTFDYTNTINSTYFFNPTWNTTGTTVNGILYYTATTRYIPDTWFPFDQMLLSTDLPLEPELFYNSQNYNFQSFDNIIIGYDINTDQPDEIYNYWKSDFTPEQGWVDFGTDTSERSENMTFKFQLRVKGNNTLVNYPLAPNEQALLKFETMVFEK